MRPNWGHSPPTPTLPREQGREKGGGVARYGSFPREGGREKGGGSG